MTDDGMLGLAMTALRQAWSLRQTQAAGEGPAWIDPRPLQELLEGSDGDLPRDAVPVPEVVNFLVREVLTRPTGNSHPGFLGWVHGSGDDLGVIAAILSAAMNANTGGRDHGAVHVERTVHAWFREIFGFSSTSSAVFTQGTSESNLLALAVARSHSRGQGVVDPDVRRERIYTTPATHDSVVKSATLLQFGAVRTVGTSPDGRGRMEPELLREMIRRDRSLGAVPVCVVGSAGMIDSGDCDPLEAIAQVCADEGVWFHVDGAFGAWLRIAPSPFDEPVRGIEHADSLAFDLHKWLPVPFAVSALLVKDAETHRATFATGAEYLMPTRALAGGPDWATNYGIALSRPFHGLAPYLIMRARGLGSLGESIAHCVVLAHYFADLIAAHPRLSLVAPVVGNVVLFEVLDNGGSVLDPDEVAAELQERGETVFSTTTRDGRRVLRACFVNHNTRTRHLEAAISELQGASRRHDRA